MKQVTNTLLTGFGPFGDVVNNPAERLVRRFEAFGHHGHRLTTCVLPVSYRRAPENLIEAIDRASADGSPFDLVLMLGVAAAGLAWRVERFARAVDAGRPDVDGLSPQPAMSGNGGQALAATIAVDAVVSALVRSGIPAIDSDSAGTFLCNFAFYAALAHVAQCGRPARTGFLHVPADPETPPASGGACFSFAQHIQAVQVSLDALAS